MVGHIFWGALFSRLFGSGFEALQISGLVAGFLGGAALYFWLRNAGVQPGRAFAGSLCLIFNPLYFVLSITFMTDVPYVAAQTAAMWVLGYASARGGFAAAATGWLLALFALSIRQVGVAIPAGIGIANLWRDGVHWRSIATAIIPVVAFVAFQQGFEAWLAAKGALPLQFGVNSIEIADRLAGPISDIMKHASIGVAYLYMYGGLFMLPVVILAYRDLIAQHRSNRLIIHAATFGAAGIVTLIVILVHRPMPIWDHGVLSSSGIALGLYGMPEAPGWLRGIVTALASGGGAMAVVVLGTRIRQLLTGSLPTEATAAVVAALATGAVLFAPLLVMPNRFDRYLLPIVPCMIVVMLVSGSNTRQLGTPAGHRGARLAALSSVVLFAGFAAFAIAGTRDSLADQRARLAALNHALSLGYPRDQINAGWVLNGWHLYGRVGALKGIGALASWYNDPLIEIGHHRSHGYEVIARMPVNRTLPWAWGADAPVLVERRLPGEGTFVGPPMQNR
ncbi:MAG: glycosyltransferase family 39 protein [Phreatobacter sp.]|uniref:hypothetical protein n=1 Tax=Phreatobacter sp. TaxID=1966341 RepID=UPI001A5CE81E|nr:hypothetical protein [Phreatobacter sp.]MBL8569781.1 glycosyltransferase family 39 protein [Phreatobacter sp.]